MHQHYNLLCYACEQSTGKHDLLISKHYLGYNLSNNIEGTGIRYST